MKKQEFELFLDELKLQVEFALFSAQNLVRLKNQNFRGEQGWSNEFWYYLQNYVIELANVSKILFISKNANEKEKAFKERQQKRDFLIQTLNISNIDTIKDKRMRNALEHIDEKLEKFTKVEKQFIFNRNITPSNDIVVNGKPYLSDDANQLRNYLTDLDVFILFGKRFNLKETNIELIGLKNSVEAGQKKLVRGELDDLFSKG